MDLSQFDYAPLALSFAHVALGVLMLIFAKLALRLLSPYAVDTEMTKSDNPAFGLAVAGYYAATVIVYIGSTSTGGLPLDAGTRGALAAMGQEVAWTLAGIVALNASRWLLDRLIVGGMHDDTEIARHRNVAAGAVECGGYLASGIILAGAIRQPSGTILTAAAFFIIGQAALILAGRLYQRWSGYRVAEEVRTGNLAAGVAYGMTLVALALLMLKAVSGEFAGWGRNLAFFGLDAVAGLALLLLLRWITDLALLPQARIADEIVKDRNVNAGLVEGVLAVGIGAIILFLF